MKDCWRDVKNQIKKSSEQSLLVDARNVKSLCTSPLSTKRNCQTPETPSKLCPNKAFIFRRPWFSSGISQDNTLNHFYSLALFHELTCPSVIFAMGIVRFIWLRFLVRFSRALSYDVGVHILYDHPGLLRRQNGAVLTETLQR